MSQPPLPSDSSGTASKEGRFCFRPLSERRCRPGNLVGSCSGGSLTRPDGSETRRYASATKLFLPPAISHFLLAGCDQSLLRWGSLASSSATCIAPASRPRASHLSQCGLQRVKADNHQPSTRFQHLRGNFQQRPQIVQFAVYEDSESLKGPGRRMNPVVLGLTQFHWPGRG